MNIEILLEKIKKIGKNEPYLKRKNFSKTIGLFK